MMKSQLLIQMLLFLLTSEACTEIRLNTVDSSVVVGRSLEEGVDAESNIIVEPKDYPHVAYKYDECTEGMKWVNQYVIQFLDFADFTNLALDGVNDAGLSVATNMFPGSSVYEDVPEDKCGQALSQVEFSMWILGNFGTTEELRIALKQESFPIIYGKILNVLGEEMLYEEHWSVIDSSGDSIIIEYTERGRQVYNNIVGVVTNSPPYYFHMENLRNYVSMSKFAYGPLILGEATFNATGLGSGLFGIPGDYTPPSRLVRAAVIKSYANTPKNSEEAVSLAFHVMNTVDIPQGVVGTVPGDDFKDYTQWVVVKDLSKKIIYFRRYNDLIIHKLHLEKFIGTVDKWMVKLELAGTHVYDDITNDLKAVNKHSDL